MFLTNLEFVVFTIDLRNNFGRVRDAYIAEVTLKPFHMKHSINNTPIINSRLKGWVTFVGALPLLTSI